MFLFITLMVLAVITATEFVSVLTPLVVFGVTEIVKIILPKLQGKTILLLIVPVISLAVAWIANFIADPGLAFWQQVIYGLLAVFVNELLKQFKTKTAE